MVLWRGQDGSPAWRQYCSISLTSGLLLALPPTAVSAGPRVILEVVGDGWLRKAKKAIFCAQTLTGWLAVREGGSLLTGKLSRLFGFIWRQRGEGTGKKL